MNTKQKVAFIKESFDKLRWVFDADWTNHALALHKQCMEEEKAHRGFGPDFAKYHPGAEAIATIGKLFACLRVAEYLQKGKRKYPRGKDYLHFQKSCFIAAGIAEEFGARIREVWSTETIIALAALDYCEFVQTDKRVA